MAKDAFQHFLHSRSGDLRKIASRTRGEHSYDDLISEAWLLAIEIGRKRDWPFSFIDEDDQDTLMAWMHNKFVKYADKTVRHAIKLDKDWDNEDSERTGATLARLLTAPADSDPQIRQQLYDERGELVAIAQRSYSQASAYVLLLIRVDWHIDDLADLLWIAAATVRNRIRTSGLLARVQRSLFDGIAKIDEQFVPYRKRRSLRRWFGEHPSSQARIFPSSSPEIYPTEMADTFHGHSSDERHESPKDALP